MNIKYKTVVLLVIALGLFLRLYRLTDLSSFSYEQALALEASGKMVQSGKISLIGAEYFIRQTSNNHSFFNSAAYLYPMSLIQYFFGYNPVYPTILFSLINVIGGVALFFLVDKYFKKSLGFIALTLYMFSPTMIEISRTVWHVYLLVPIIVLSIWSYMKYLDTSKSSWLAILGFSFGLGFGMHISFVLGIGVLTLFCIFYLYKKRKLLNLIYILFGFIVGYSPIVFFDLRHSFYNTSTMLIFLLELFTNHGSGFSFTSYYFIYFLVPLFIFIAIVLHKVYSSKKITIILLLFIALSCQSWRLRDIYPSGMPWGTNINTIAKISSVIAKDVSGEFEVASIVDGETRAENLRYYLEFVDQKVPMASNKYPEASVIYVVSYLNQDPKTKSVWELNSMKPLETVSVWQINDILKLTKLQKVDGK